MDRAKDFLSELRDHWDDHYWWANHPALRIALLAVVSGAIGLLFTWLETRIKLTARAAEETT
jgi:hypothetical protein